MNEIDEIDLSVLDFETERLHMRPMVSGDEALYCGLYTDPETMRFIAPPLSADDAASSFQKVVARQREPSIRGRVLVILERTTLQSLGICATSKHDAGDLRLEVGIVLKPEACARGFAREALTALMERVFAVSTTQEICARFSAHSPAAKRLHSRMGFTHCTDELGEEGKVLTRFCWVHRSSWRTDQAVN